MWFIISDDLIVDDLNNQYIKSGLEQLLYSVSNGYHAISGKRDTLKHLKDKAGLSSVPNSILQRAISSSASDLPEANRSLFKIYVLAEFDGHIRRIKGNEANSMSWEISLKWISQNGIPRSYLLCEDLIDACLLEKAAEHFFISQNKKKSLISIRKMNGGGSQTPVVYKSEIDDKASFVLCITDTDKLFPGMQDSSTVKKCRAIFEENNWINFYSPIAGAREMENIIPINLIQDYINNCQQDVDLKNRFNEFLNLDEKYRLFADMKNGTSLKSITKDVNLKKYWSELCKDMECNKECDNDNCKCSCFITPALTEKIANSVFDSYINKNSSQEIEKRIRNSSNTGEWMRLGEIVGSWGACIKKQRS